MIFIELPQGGMKISFRKVRRRKIVRCNFSMTLYSHDSLTDCHPERSARECAHESKDPEDAGCNHATSGSSNETSFLIFYWPYSRVFAFIRGLVLALERGREADLRAERLASGAGNFGSSEFLGAVWSAATKLKPMAILAIS